MIKNVAGYDLAKLFAGSFGTLGAIVEVAVRLHPMSPTASAGGHGDDPGAVAAAAIALAHSQLEAQALDLAWRGGRGGVLARFAGRRSRSRRRKRRACSRSGARRERDRATTRGVGGAARAQRGDLSCAWLRCRRGSRACCARPSASGGSWCRAALGVCWISLPADAGAAAFAQLRAALAPSSCVVLDAPEDVRAELDPWGFDDGPGARADAPDEGALRPERRV